MKTILINRTLTTIALISTIQCGWGTVTLSSWSSITSNSNQNGNTYTLKTGNNYKIKPSNDIYLTNTLEIPKGVAVRYEEGTTHYFYIGKKDTSSGVLRNSGTFTNTTSLDSYKSSQLQNMGTFKNGENSSGWLRVFNNLTINNVKGTINGTTYNSTFNNYWWIYTNAKNSSITFSGNGNIYNNGNIDTGSEAPGSNITYSGNGDIINNNTMRTEGTNSFINFSGSGNITNNSGATIYTNTSDSSIMFSGSGDITNNKEIYTNASDSSITFSGSGNINNGTEGHIYTNVASSAITFSGSRIINNYHWIRTKTGSAHITFSDNVTINNYSDGDIFTGSGSSGSFIEFTGNSQVNNNGAIDTYVAGSSVVFSGGSADTPQIVTTSGTSSKSGGIYLGKANSSMTIGQYSILSFGDYGKFYASASKGNVTLNGTISITSQNASVNLNNMNISGSGSIDMSPLRPYSANSTELTTFSNHDFFTFASSQALPNIKLPFNCKFSTALNLRNAASVSYTVLKISSVTIDNDYIIKKGAGGTYGNYANNSNSGVTLPSDTSKIHITEETQGETGMSLSDLAADTTTYNILGAGYKLLTDDLDDATHNISADTSYNFGFKGTKAISITGSGKAVFKGDNSTYDPSSAVILPDNVEFGANDSLFRFTETYGHGTFSAGNYTNTIPSGKTGKFTSGFTLGKGHTLIVKGTLIG